jgi:hypothetical protein
MSVICQQQAAAAAELLLLRRSAMVADTAVDRSLQQQTLDGVVTGQQMSLLTVSRCMGGGAAG